jgi:hypothetical protein
LRVDTPSEEPFIRSNPWGSLETVRELARAKSTELGEFGKADTTDETVHAESMASLASGASGKVAKPSRYIAFVICTLT